jgi:sulfotransferase family protein
MTTAGARTSVGQLPNFLVIGAMKAGTSSLYQYLRAHPQIFMPAAKELSFFAYEPNARHDLEWYRRQFASAGEGAVALGEASTMYTKFPRHPGVPERIAARIPGAKFVYVIRDPVERIRSHYEHQRNVGAEHAPIEEAVMRDPAYLDCSRYAMQIERYLEHFPREQLLVVTSEELRSERAKTVANVYEFLGVDREFVPDNLEHEFFRTDERVPHPAAAWRIRRALKRRFPATRRIRLNAVPGIRTLGRVRHRAAAKSTDHVAGPLMTEQLRAELVGFLREDVARLHGYMPPDFAGWGIA